MWKEFCEFAIKGNVVDLAIGVIIGSAFGKIVTSSVKDLIMPVVALLTGKVDLSHMFLALDGKVYFTLEEAQKAGAATLNYGNFLTTVADFLIIAFVILLMVKQANRLRMLNAPAPKKEPPKTKLCPFCLSEVPPKAVKCRYCTSALE